MTCSQYINMLIIFIWYVNIFNHLLLKQTPWSTILCASFELSYRVELPSMHSVHTETKRQMILRKCVRAQAGIFMELAEACTAKLRPLG